MTKKLLTILIGGLFLTLVMGCETMKGAGKDLETSGQNVQETVEKND